MSRIKTLFFLIFLTFLWGWILVDGKNNAVKLINESHQEKLLKERLASSSGLEKISRQKVLMSNMTIMEDVANLAQQNQVSVDYLKIGEVYQISAEDFLRIKLVAMGDFSSVVNFIQAMNGENNIYVVNHVSLLPVDQNNMKIGMDLSVSKFSYQAMASQEIKKTVLHDPFAPGNFSETDANWVRHRALAMSVFSVYQMQVTGYLLQAKQKSSLIKLPSGESFPVNVGDKLGLEQADVVEVNKQGMVLKVGRKEVLLKYKT